MRGWKGEEDWGKGKGGRDRVVDGGCDAAEDTWLRDASCVCVCVILQ